MNILAPLYSKLRSNLPAFNPIKKCISNNPEYVTGLAAHVSLFGARSLGKIGPFNLQEITMFLHSSTRFTYLLSSTIPRDLSNITSISSKGARKYADFFSSISKFLFDALIVTKMASNIDLLSKESGQLVEKSSKWVAVAFAVASLYEIVKAGIDIYQATKKKPPQRAQTLKKESKEEVVKKEPFPWHLLFSAVYHSCNVAFGVFKANIPLLGQGQMLAVRGGVDIVRSIAALSADYTDPKNTSR